MFVCLCRLQISGGEAGRRVTGGTPTAAAAAGRERVASPAWRQAGPMLPTPVARLWLAVRARGALRGVPEGSGRLGNRRERVAVEYATVIPSRTHRIPSELRS